MNILYLLTHSLEVGGAQKDVFAFVETYSKHGHKVVVACRNAEFAEDIIALGAKYHEINFHFRSFFAFKKAVRELRNIIYQEDIDLIAPQSIRTAMVACFANNKAKKPIITTIHNIHFWLNSLLSGIILNITSSQVIFESEYERKKLVLLGLNPWKAITVHSGIDMQKFSPKPKDQTLLQGIGCSRDDLIIGNVARLSQEKGQTYLLEAMAEVVKTIPQAQLIVVGDGPCKKTLIKYTKRLHLEKHVKFLGEQKDIPRCLSIMDVFVLSSVKDSFPLSAREAMAMGKPIVATKVGGCSEIVSDGISGILVEPAQSKSLGSALVSLLSNKEKIFSMGNIGRKLTLQLFDKQKWLDTNEKIITYCVTNKSLKIPNTLFRKIISTFLFCLYKFDRKENIRILMYHRVTDTEPRNRLCVKLNEFRKQMDFLYRNNYEVVSLDAAVKELTEAGFSGRKKIVITFDDGTDDNYTNVYPILSEYGFPATVFLAVNYIGKAGFLNWPQIQEMYRNNIAFGAHTINHLELNKLNLAEAKHEIEDSKKDIIAQGINCEYFCYPKGAVNNAVKDLVLNAGFRGACSIKPGANFPGQDLFELKRTEISGFDSIFDFRKKLVGAYDFLHKLAQRNSSLYKDNPKERINVLYIIWSLGLGGAERVVINLAKGLDKSKFKTTICCLNDKGAFAHELEEIGIEVIALNKKSGIDVSIIGKIIKVIKDKEISIVHAHLWGANFWGRIAAWLVGVPVVIITEHNEDTWKNKLHFICDYWLSFCTDKIVTVSKSVEQFYINNAKLAPKKMKVIYNGIDTNLPDNHSYLKESNIRSEFNISVDEVVLAVIGRLVPQKGHRYFFLALKELLSTHKMKGLVVGSGPLEKELKEFASRLGLNGHVIFTGLRQDIHSFLRVIDILVMPSTREGLPMVALEAMANDVPVIATDVGGNPELITDQQTGLLIKPEDYLALKDSINRIITDQNLSLRIVNNAKELVRNEFDITVMVNKTQQLYSKLYSEKCN